MAVECRLKSWSISERKIEVRDIFKQSRPATVIQKQSIGIVNVNERLLLYLTAAITYRVCRASRCSVSYYNSDE